MRRSFCDSIFNGKIIIGEADKNKVIYQKILYDLIVMLD